jgi:hypothetical protein
LGGSDISSEQPANCGWTNAQRAAVIEELNLIHSHPAFKSSNRCVNLLDYLVQCALNLGEHDIKERTIGVEVFGRDPDYDVGIDPIVRRIAGEIRKRLAQYYHEQQNNRRVTIHLLRGSYLPTFEFRAEVPDFTLPHAATVEPLKEAGTTLPPEPAQLPRTASLSYRRVNARKWILAAAALLFTACACCALIWMKTIHSPLYRVWKPLLDSGEVIMVCLPIRDDLPVAEDQQRSQAASNSVSPSSTDSQASAQASSPSTIFRDVYAGNTITALISTFRKQTSLRPATAIKFRDFRQMPAVLIGGSNNPWVPILLSSLRYSVQYDAESHEAWIRDAQNPSMHEWSTNRARQSTGSSEQYAIVSRVFNQQSGQWVIALSGLEAEGTEAAAELVVDPKYAKLIPAAITEKGNFQIVLKTTVIGGEPGPLQVLAVQSW